MFDMWSNMSDTKSIFGELAIQSGRQRQDIKLHNITIQDTSFHQKSFTDHSATGLRSTSQQLSFLTQNQWEPNLAVRQVTSSLVCSTVLNHISCPSLTLYTICLSNSCQYSNIGCSTQTLCTGLKMLCFLLCFLVGWIRY